MMCPPTQTATSLVAFGIKTISQSHNHESSIVLNVQMLERGDLAAAGGLPLAWLAKARMQLQECDESGALDTAMQGLKFLLKQQANPTMNLNYIS